MDDAHPLQSWQARRVLAWGRLLVGLVLVAMIGVLARVVQLKVDPDPRMLAAVGKTISSRQELARRGDLLDRRGRVIAATTVGHRLFVDPSFVEDPATLAVDLASIIGGDPVEIDKQIAGRWDTRYAPIGDVLEAWQVDALRARPLRGVGLEPRFVRQYPAGIVAASLLGKVGFEHTGLSGLERRFDEALLAERGELTYLRDARRRAIWIETAGYRPGADGSDIRLSVDLVIQEIAEQRLAEAVETCHAGGGRIVVVDCRTGELLAAHDLLNPRAGWDEQTDDPARDDDPALGRNRCVTDPYEPGSTFKPFVWAVATGLGLADPDETLATPKSGVHRTTFGRRIRDSHPHEDQTWREVLIHSMNSGMSIVSERMTHAQMQDIVRRFGFGERTGSGVPGESPGIVTTPGAWSDYTQTSVAMGHEIAVTPLQMVRAFCVLARDGTMPNVRFTALGGHDGRPTAGLLRRVIPAETARRTREVLRDVMLEGTGRPVQSERYSMFGKSGTAQLPRKEGGGYHEDRYVSSFIAGAPFDDPRIVVLCVIDDPDRSKAHYGSRVAGPAVRDVIDRTLQYLGEPGDL